MKRVFIFLATPFIWLRKMFFQSPEDFKLTTECPYSSKIESEEELAENVIKNNQQKASSLGIDPFSEPATEYIDIENNEVVFEEKIPDSELVKIKKSRRILTYKIETKNGLVLYKGRKISKFIEESKLDLGFTQREVYRFAEKYQRSKIFKKKYYVSFEEVSK